MWCHGCSSYQILKVTNFCRLFLQSISCSISFPISPTPSYPLLSELLSIFPCFSYYRSFLILIILPTSNLFSCHFIIHVADKLVIKHSFNLVISPTWRLHQLSTTYRWSPKGLFWQFKTLTTELQPLQTALTIHVIGPVPQLNSALSCLELFWFYAFAETKPAGLECTFSLYALNSIHHSSQNASPLFFVKASKFTPAQVIFLFLWITVEIFFPLLSHSFR